MATAYQAVQWNRQKRWYDAALALGTGGFLAVFIGITKLLHPTVTDEILLLRATACAAFLLLHVILCIGPLCRLQPRFLPLLYNRRHAGVTMAILALIHAALALVTYHAGGDRNPFVSLFVSEKFTGSLATLPFQPFGFVALLILLLMASTSHDFWLRNLTAPVWKALHMLVYVAYAALIAHVTLGVLQAETHPLYALATGTGLATVLGLHIASAMRERRIDLLVAAEMSRLTTIDRPGTPPAHFEPSPRTPAAADGFVDACAVADIPDNRARILCLSGERVAIFKYAGKISAVSNVCQHQNGPLGEGRIRDGCITCPWHGYQYLPDTGASPPPFTEKVPTFQVRVENGRVWVHPRPNPPGTRVEPATASGPRANPVTAAADNPLTGAVSSCGHEGKRLSACVTTTRRDPAP